MAGLLIAPAAQLGLCQAPPQWFPGDVFVAVGSGQYKVYHNTGTASSPNYVLVETLTDGIGGSFTTGCALDSSSNLFTTNFSNTKVVKFDANSPHSVLQTIDTNARDSGGNSESVLFDSVNNLFVGDPDGGHLLLKYDSTGTFVTSFTPTREARGTDWIDLAADQKTLFYTSEGTHVKRFDVSANSQLADFNSTALPGSIAFALRLLSPFDGTGGLLVADTDRIVRLDGSGADVQEYNVTTSKTCPTTNTTCPNENTFFALNLDPNGTSFWAGAFGTANFYRFNISTGAIEVGPINTGTGANTLFGICLKGQPAPVNTVMLNYPTGTTTQVALFNQGDTQNNHTWKATVNATSPFSITVSAHEVVCDSGVACGTDDFDGLNNYRCRWAEFFSGDPQLPKGVPYSHNMCVYYRVENQPPTSDYTGDVTIASGYVDPPGTPAATPFCSTLTSGSFVTRIFRDPSSPPPPDAALNHSFAFDYTTFFNESAGIDPIIGGSGHTFNDYAVACRDTTGKSGSAIWLSPTSGEIFNAGSAINLQVRLTDWFGNKITDAVISGNVMPLMVTGPPGFTAQTFGAGGDFWFYDSTDDWYAGTWKSPKSPTGAYNLCVSSTRPSQLPYFAGSVCVPISLR